MSISQAQAKRIMESRKRVSTEKKAFLLRPVEPNRRQEIRYRNLLSEAIDKTKDAVLQLYNSSNDIGDVDGNIDDLFENMEWWDELSTQVGQNLESLDDFHQEAFYHTVTSSVGINVAGFVNEQGLRDLLDVMIEDNVQKITDLKISAQKRVADLVKNALTGQESKSGTLRDQILESFTGATYNQAKFIARDQTQRNINALNRFRQERAGIKKYKWSTSRDNRVGSDHKKMEGLEVDWGTGIILSTPLSRKRDLAGKNVKEVANGHVGQRYQCRCSAIPILEV